MSSKNSLPTLGGHMELFCGRLPLMVRKRLTLTQVVHVVIGKGVSSAEMSSYLQDGGRLPQPDGCTDAW